MKIFNDFRLIANIPNPVLTIGTFDGVHIGHQKIIKQLNEEANKIGGESVLFTFFPHPRMVLSPENHGLKLIQSQEEKLEKPWLVSDAPTDFIEKLLPAIVGFEVVVNEIYGKFKLSQNQPQENRIGIAEGLEKRGHEMAEKIKKM